MLSAEFSQSGNQYQIKLTGESDNGGSAYYIKLSSGSPISPGVYQVYTGKSLDSMYFMPAGSGGLITYHSFGYPQTFCRIISMDNHLIVGNLYGRFELGPDI